MSLRGSLALACLLVAALAALGNEPSSTLDLGEKPAVFAFAFSPDGRLLALYNNQADKDKALTLWDVATKKRLAVLKSDWWQSSAAFCFTADGKSLIVYGTSSTTAWKGSSWVIVWDMATFKERRCIKSFEKISDPNGPLLFTPAGKRMIWVSASRGILVFDLATGKVTKTIQDPNYPIGKVSVLALSPDGKTLAVGTTGAAGLGARIPGGGALYLCDLEKGEVRHRIPDAGIDGDRGESGRFDIRLLAFSPDGTRLVSCAEGGRVMVWDPATGKNLDFLRVGFSLGELKSLAFSPDGKTLAMANRAVALWDVGAGGFRDDFRVVPNPIGKVRRLAFSPDGKTLLTAGDDVTVQFWDVPAGAPKSVRQDTSPTRAPDFPAHPPSPAAVPLNTPPNG